MSNPEKRCIRCYPESVFEELLMELLDIQLIAIKIFSMQVSRPPAQDRITQAITDSTLLTENIQDHRTHLDLGELTFLQTTNNQLLLNLQRHLNDQ